MNNTQKRTAFISYHTDEAENTSSNLSNYLLNCNVDAFCDRKRPTNHGSLKEVLQEEICKRDNFILLSTAECLRKLIDYQQMPFDSEIDWVEYELSTAFKNGKSIIPVFLDRTYNFSEVQRLYKKLFLKYGKSDYHIVFRDLLNDEELFRSVECCISYPEIIARTDLSHIYWVGTRLSDIEMIEERFKGYIVLFGEKHDPANGKYVMCSKSSSRRVDHNDSTDLTQDQFIEESIMQIVQADSCARFMFYNPATFYRLNFKGNADNYRSRVLCLNSKSLLEQINNKSMFRVEMETNCVVPMLPLLSRTRADCEYEDLVDAKINGKFRDDCCRYEKFMRCNSFNQDICYDEKIRFVVQAPVSSGGSGTFILDESNARYLLSSLDPRAHYLVSIYHTKNIPVNIHVLIDDNQIVPLPASVQLELEVESENKLLYKGADYVAYQMIDNELRHQFEAQATSVAEYLKQRGYRGILGVDAIIHNGRVNVLEVNARFQASTELINRAFLQRGWKTLHELNIDCFSESGISQADVVHCNSVSVNFSNLSYSYEGRLNHEKQLFNRAIKCTYSNSIHVQGDGFDPNITAAEQLVAQSYLYRIVFPGNISSISEDGTVWINENLISPQNWLYRKIKGKDILAIKIALLIQGITIDSEIKAKYREATNNAVDLQLNLGKNIMVVNSPTNIRYVFFSPFELKPSQEYLQRYSIYYYGELLIDNVEIFEVDKNQNLKCKKSGSNRAYSEVAYLSTDRLRVHLTNACIYKLQGKGCRFCNIPIEQNKTPIDMMDIEEVVEKYIEDKDANEKNLEQITLRHFLIGGQSLENCDSRLVDTSKILGKYNMPIYVMTLPLKDETIRMLIENGVLEFAYNIEIFDPDCRAKYMPGKGVLSDTVNGKDSVAYYFERLKRTRQILNASNYNNRLKVVRSMVLVGLEPVESMITGIRNLIDIGVEPMLSVFRPLPDTDLEYLNAPPIKYVYDLFRSVSKMLYASSRICDASFIKWNSEATIMTGEIKDYRKLGPECNCCQNNTISLPWRLQKALIREPTLTYLLDTENIEK